jgi:hypothetical protein
VRRAPERRKLKAMRAMAAAAAAGLFGLLILSQPSDQPRSGRGPSGRAGARRARPQADRADGGGSDAGGPSGAGPGGGVTERDNPGRRSSDETPGGGATRRTRERAPHVLGDPPGTIRVSTGETPADAGPPADGRAQQVEKLDQQISELRSRTAALEAQLARSQGQAAQLQQLNDQMGELRAMLAAEAQRRAQAEQAQAAQRQQVQEAISSLLSAQQLLAAGSSDVSAALNQAEATFEGVARRDVAAARQALQNRDLAGARYFLGAAVAHAQQQTR